MRAPITAFVLLAALAAAAPARGSARPVEDLVRDLASPFEDARRAAVDRLAASGAAADDALLALYPRADFRTKALVLEVFARAARPAGLPLVFADLTVPDRGVVHAQREYLSALYRAAHDRARRRLAAFVDDDWETHEAVLALPAAIPTARRALSKLANGPEPARAPAREVLAWIEDLDRGRARLAELALAEDPEIASRAGQLAALLLRHDTERAFLAVHEAGADGSYRGMYRLLAELVRKTEDGGPGGSDPLEVLLRIVFDQPLPEAGVPAARSTSYPFVERLPAWLDRDEVRGHAATALGDVAAGRRDVALRLRGWFATRPPSYDRIASIDYQVALACSDLGVDGPVSEVVEYLESRLEARFISPWTADLLLARLAIAYARLGRFDDAVGIYVGMPGKSSIDYYNLACVLARADRTEESLRALRRSLEEGYGLDPSELVWMQRDQDLEPLRDTEEYAELLRLARRRLAEGTPGLPGSPGREPEDPSSDR